MDMKDIGIGCLIWKYLIEDIEPWEQNRLDNWRMSSPGNQQLFNRLTSEEWLISALKKYFARKVWEELKECEKNPRLRFN